MCLFIQYRCRIFLMPILRRQRAHAHHLRYYHVHFGPYRSANPLTSSHTFTHIFYPVSGSISADSALIWLSVWRIVLGIGVGGDYPMSASVTSDRTKIRKRGTMLAFVFANQGWGSLVGSLVTIVVLSIYKPVMHNEGKTSKVDGGELSFWFFIHGLWWVSD